MASGKIVRKLAELPVRIYYQRLNYCRPGKVYADIRGDSLERGVNESVVVENGDFRFFRALSSEKFFSYMHATQQLSRDTTVDDLGDIARSLDCFTSNFS